MRNEATTTESIGDEIARLAAELTVGEHRLVRKIGDFDASGDWARQGALTCAHWLAWRIVLAPGAAREKVRVARALPTLPHIDHAFERGELSYSKVRAVTRVPRKVSRQCGADCSSSSAGSLAMTRGS